MYVYMYVCKCEHSYFCGLKQYGLTLYSSGDVTNPLTYTSFRNVDTRHQENLPSCLGYNLPHTSQCAFHQRLNHKTCHIILHHTHLRNSSDITSWLIMTTLPLEDSVSNGWVTCCYPQLKLKINNTDIWTVIAGCLLLSFYTLSSYFFITACGVDCKFQ
jgi:hypothetical protein